MKNIRLLFIVGALILVLVVTPVFVLGSSPTKTNSLDSLVVSKGDLFITPINCTDGIDLIQGNIQNTGNSISPDISIEITLLDYAGRPCDVKFPAENGQIVVHIGMIAGGQTVPFSTNVITTDTDVAGDWTYSIVKP